MAFQGRALDSERKMRRRRASYVRWRMESKPSMELDSLGSSWTGDGLVVVRKEEEEREEKRELK